jgi:hypothetical protein
MLQSVPGQMTWKPPGFLDSVLHLRQSDTEPWQHYKAFPEYVVPDPPGFSEGYATFLKLLKQNWQSL